MTRHSLADSIQHGTTNPELIVYGVLVVAVMVAIAYLKGRMDNAE